MKLALTLLVRNEQDIVVANLEHHLHAGVDFVYVTDNLSSDATRDLLQPYVRAEVATVIEEQNDDFSQSVWVTRMARLAHEEGAHWVINGDADEFWWVGETRDLKGLFQRIDSTRNVVVARRSDFPPVEGGQLLPFWERMTLKKAQSLNALGRPLPPKVAHRASPSVVVAQGNHTVTGLGSIAAVEPLDLEILHFPIRSRDQFTRKIANGGAAYARNGTLGANIGSTWRHLYAAYRKGTLDQYYRNQVVGDDHREDLIATGHLVEDTRLRDRLRTILAPVGAPAFSGFRVS